MANRSGVNKDGLLIEKGYFPKDAISNMKKAQKPATKKETKKK